MPEKTSHPIAKLFENYEEIVEPEKAASVEGTIPDWLSATLLRNGPGMFKIGNTEYSHWFDGMAYIQRYYFKDGQMFYSARYLQSETYKINMAANRIVVGEFGTKGFPDPCKSLLGRFQTFFSGDHLTDNASVNFFIVGDTIWAATETPKIIQIDKTNLDALERVDMSKYLALNTFTAHQQYDFDGNVYHIGAKYGKTSKYVFSKTMNIKDSDKHATDALAETTLVGQLDAHGSPAYFHSFGMTENYIILFESPLRVDALKLGMRKLLNIGFQDAMFWKDDEPVHIRVLNKNSGEELAYQYRHSSFFSFHQANAYEKDGCIVMDFCAMKESGTLSSYDLDEIKSGSLSGDHRHPNKAPYLYRLVIPVDIQKESCTVGHNLLAGKDFAKECKAVYESDNTIWLQYQKLSELSFEFPQINRKHNLVPHKYVFGSTVLFHTGKPGLVKVNVETGETTTWDVDHDQQLATEPIFVAKPDGTDEDDGILLAPILNYSDDDTPFVLVLDAKTFTEVARCRVNHRLPLGFHAQVYPD